ncbi:MAG: hypothetical protein HUJ92_02000 [Bacteroidales bacterium]|nr:hypothetical protein [Bacteroidales bacterium]
MKKFFITLVSVLAFTTAASAQDYLTPQGSFIASIGFNFGMNPASSAGFGYDFGGVLEYCFYSKGHSSFGVAASVCGIPFQNHETKERMTSIIAMPQVSYHYGLSQNWDLYAKGGVGCSWIISDKSTKASVYPEIAIGTRVRIYKPLCFFVELGFPYGSVGLSLLF